MPHNSMAVDSPEAGSAPAARFIEPSFLNALPHFLPLVVLPLIFLALLWGGWWIILPLILFIIQVSPLDIAFGDDERNMNPASNRDQRLIWHNLPVWIWAFTWPPILAFGFWQIFVAGQFEIWESLLLIAVLGTEIQAVFIVGHELSHRRTTWERRFGEFLLASASYPQYATEHVYIHHAFVGTPYDAGSAPKGLSFWRYILPEVASNLSGSWRVAREQLARKRLPVWHRSNPFWRYGLATAFWYGLFYWMGGIWAVLTFFVISAGAVFSMKISNYMQHYGLRRVVTNNGRFERALPRHSWSANYKLSNWLFFNMQRHADHHATASRPYPLLQYSDADQSPQLPGTYAQMFNLVLRPKLWFETMDPLVDQWRKKFYPDIEDWRAHDSQLSSLRPKAFDTIVEIFAVSPRLAEWIERHPELLDSLQEREFTDLDLPRGFGLNADVEVLARQGLARLYWTHEYGVAEMRENIDEIPFQDVSDQVDAVRNWSNDKGFQIAMHALRGNLTPVEAARAMSNVAEATITAVLSAVAESLAVTRQSGSSGGVAVVFLGDLASGELAADSSPEILFVYRNGSHGQGQGLCAHFQNAIEELLTDSLIFRPSHDDGAGCTVCSMDSFTENSETTAAAIDLLTLTRARCVLEFGAGGIGAEFEAVRQEILTGKAARDKLRGDSTAASRNAATASLADFESGAGGRNEVERIARQIQVLHALKVADNPAPTAVDVFRAAAEQGPIAASVAETLVQAATLWRNLHGMLKLVGDEDMVPDRLGAKARFALARCCRLDNFEKLASTTDTMAEQAAVVIAKLEARTENTQHGSSAESGSQSL